MQAKIFFSVLVILSFLASSMSMAAESANISDAEAKAKTNFDHIKLAEYYENEAKAMSAKAEEQKELLDEYKNHSEYYGREGQDFQFHHEALLREYTKAAERNAQMAVSHRNMSRKVKGL
ncbi:MAG: hypothetical protein AABZ18_07200 [Pseudomonadota bacterium]